jgi:hypothetical protein
MNMVEGMDMVEDMTTEVDMEVVEKEHKGVVLVKHWIGDGADMHQRTHQKWELVKSDVEKVTPRLQVQSLIVQHYIE